MLSSFITFLCLISTSKSYDDDYSEEPTIEPTETIEPTISLDPTVEPTLSLEPSQEPTISCEPTVDPTSESPTIMPSSEEPSVEPTTYTPTVQPTTLAPTTTNAPTSLYQYINTGSKQLVGNFVVPPSAVFVHIKAYGAQGGTYFNNIGGDGQYLELICPVAQGTVYYYEIGAVGGGGACPSAYGGAGGGLTYMGTESLTPSTALSSILFIAGGGGGGGASGGCKCIS